MFTLKVCLLPLLNLPTVFLSMLTSSTEFFPFTVIKEFGKNIGAESKQVQGLIRLAKKNGEKLGFLS